VTFSLLIDVKRRYGILMQLWRRAKRQQLQRQQIWLLLQLLL